MREEGKEGNKRRPWMRLEVSGGGGILVLGGVIIAAAWAAHRRHVNRERNKRGTTQGTGDEAGYEQYHKEKEEEVKDGSKDERFGQISAAVDDGLLEIKKVGSVPLIKEQTTSCYFDDGGTELCVRQSHTEETERAVEKIEMVVDHVEQVERKDGGQEVGEEKVNSCNKDDGCDEVGEGEALNQVPIPVEDDTKQVDKEEEEERDLSFIDVLPGDESFVTVLMANVEVLEDVRHQRKEEEEQVYHKESCEEDQICDEMLFGHALNQVPIHVEDDTKQVEEEEEEEERDLSSIDVLPKDESFVTMLMANVEVLEDVHHQREEEVYLKEAKEVPDTESCEEERELLISNGVMKDEGESCCREEEVCNSEEEIEALVVEEIEKGGEELEANEGHADKEESFSNVVVPKDEELDANIEPVEEETELTANTEEVEEETESSDDSGVIETDDSGVIETDATEAIETDETDETDESDAVWPAEVIETDETENQMKINDKSGQATMKKLVITMDKEKGKEFFYMMSHSGSMFLLVLAMALVLGLLSFHLSQFTVV